MPHIWLRAEAKPFEQRAALTPAAARELITSGHTVSVEECVNRIFGIEQYRQAGCRIVPAASWQDAPEGCYVLGLKELPEPLPALQHRHIYFAHAYKQQAGWRQLLNKFADDGGRLFDLEYLLDGNGQRIAAFGYWAGFAGAALGVMNWMRHPGTMEPIRSYPDRNQLLAEVTNLLEMSETRPRAIIIGAKGRSGRGAAELCQSLEIETTLWDMEETAQGGPFGEILEHDIFLNCVLVQSDPRPFITNDLLEKKRLLTSVVDVSCDPYSVYNPLPVYTDCTTFARPALRLRDKPVLDLIAIDHLPSMLPKESSEDFSGQLLGALLELPDGRTWQRAVDLFEDKKAQAMCQGNMLPAEKH
ncbi:MAG: saccharopine dehydrogenase [Gammaproteobacteria bacterium]|nr:saccharopine dehydrogenase [Gammaproteobacteria bacterium]